MTRPAEQGWLEGALKALAPPADLRARNLQQLILIDRFRQQFRVTPLEALETIAPVYAHRFPH